MALTTNVTRKRGNLPLKIRSPKMNFSGNVLVISVVNDASMTIILSLSRTLHLDGP